MIIHFFIRLNFVELGIFARFTRKMHGWLKPHELGNLPFAIRNLQFAGEPVRSEVGGAPLTMTGSSGVGARAATKGTSSFSEG